MGELGPSDSHTTPPTPHPPRLGTFLFQPPLDSAVHPTGSLLERSGSLRHDFQTQNLKNGHFWSLQLGSGKALAAARTRFSFSVRILLWCPFWINLGPQNGPQHFMMATLGALFLNLGPYWERLSVRSRVSCAKFRHSWPQTCSKSYAHHIFAPFGALTWACSSLLPRKRNLF